MSTLAKAIMLAAKHHEGQKDKGGNPYVFHPFRLMLRAMKEEDRIVAVLHDTIEETALTLEDLRHEGFGAEIIAAVDSLTRREEESYDEFIMRIKRNPLARRVKVLDLQDNTELTRTKKPSEKTVKRLEKYSKALDMLLS
ncbi:HD domain-containing protein [uncultured Paenibacillus sp.]|uniref:HD domain-containing protein n=1 Tax=uncultured Paenibacillus sp. TaxID=227322 RepID=UPI0028D56309|nr:HD domain-containing protein [uncultured Paenibacillus sp.]